MVAMEYLSMPCADRKKKNRIRSLPNRKQKMRNRHLEPEETEIPEDADEEEEIDLSGMETFLAFMKDEDYDRLLEEVKKIRWQRILTCRKDDVSGNRPNRFCSYILFPIFHDNEMYAWHEYRRLHTRRNHVQWSITGRILSWRQETKRGRGGAGNHWTWLTDCAANGKTDINRAVDDGTSDEWAGTNCDAWFDKPAGSNQEAKEKQRRKKVKIPNDKESTQEETENGPANHKTTGTSTEKKQNK